MDVVSDASAEKIPMHSDYAKVRALAPDLEYTASYALGRRYIWWAEPDRPEAVRLVHLSADSACVLCIRTRSKSVRPICHFILVFFSFFYFNTVGVVQMPK